MMSYKSVRLSAENKICDRIKLNQKEYVSKFFSEDSRMKQLIYIEDSSSGYTREKVGI